MRVTVSKAQGYYNYGLPKALQYWICFLVKGRKAGGAVLS